MTKIGQNINAKLRNGTDNVVTKLGRNINAKNILAEMKLILLTKISQNISVWNSRRQRNGCASAREPNFAPFPTLAFLKRYRNGCASVREPNSAPFSTLSSVKRHRNGCASVKEPNFAPFPTLASSSAIVTDAPALRSCSQLQCSSCAKHDLLEGQNAVQQITLRVSTNREWFAYPETIFRFRVLQLRVHRFEILHLEVIAPEV
jgi:hypothetical protein